MTFDDQNPPLNLHWRLDLCRLLGLMAMAMAIGVGLAELYALGRLVQLSGWKAPAALHGLISLVVLVVWTAKGRLRSLLSARTVDPSAPEWLKASPWKAYLPATIVIVGAAGLTMVSRALGGGHVRPSVSTNLAWVLLIPVIEEVVFRVGIGSYFRSLGGLIWGAWFSAVTFAFVHTSPSIERVLAGEVGVPVGPFLLGLVCEAIFVITGRLWPVVGLHAACNGTVVIFAMGDERWLHWLSFLYS